MVNKSLSRALCVIRAAVRMKMMMESHRHAELDDAEQPLVRRLSNVSKPSGRASMHSMDTPQSGRHMHGTSELDVLLARPRYSIAAELRSVFGLVTSSYFCWLLVVIPFGLAAATLQWGPLTIFILNFLALIPLALILGDVTEDLALRFGATIGGLLNATFGNVVEVVLAVSALEKGLYTVVATSLLGSILSNLLLVLGCCMLVGGLYHKVQRFSTVSNQAHTALLFLAVIGIAIPTSASHVIDDPSDILDISRVSAVVLLACYLCYLIFQLKTHTHMFEEDDEEDGDEEGEEPLLATSTGILLLGIISVLVAFHCEYLAGSIEEVSSQTNLSHAFLGMIVLPIAGNACEHLAAVVVAAKNKMDLSLGIAVGSGLQISLFAIPFIVLVSWAIGKDFSLQVDPFSLLALLFSVIHCNFITASGSSHWLMGVALVAVYILLAATYYYR
mmetsp:Transcript_35152/g.78246  ORF Transcript_35152/g.78246 Transcript_35152/m.78246 type:complete len:446 (+) Transcript_35152:127-1464(+)